MFKKILLVWAVLFVVTFLAFIGYKQIEGSKESKVPILIDTRPSEMFTQVESAKFVAGISESSGYFEVKIKSNISTDCKLSPTITSDNISVAPEAVEAADSNESIIYTFNLPINDSSFNDKGLVSRVFRCYDEASYPIKKASNEIQITFDKVAQQVFWFDTPYIIEKGLYPNSQTTDTITNGSKFRVSMSHPDASTLNYTDSRIKNGDVNENDSFWYFIVRDTAAGLPSPRDNGVRYFREFEINEKLVNDIIWDGKSCGKYFRKEANANNSEMVFYEKEIDTVCGPGNYSVEIYNGFGERIFNKLVLLKPEALAPVDGLRVSNRKDVRISWEPYPVLNTETVKYTLKVYSSKDLDNNSKILSTSVDLDQSNYTISDLNDAKTYFYVVEANVSLVNTEETTVKTYKYPVQTFELVDSDPLFKITHIEDSGNKNMAEGESRNFKVTLDPMDMSSSHKEVYFDSGGNSLFADDYLIFVPYDFNTNNSIKYTPGKETLIIFNKDVENSKQIPNKLVLQLDTWFKLRNVLLYDEPKTVTLILLRDISMHGIAQPNALTYNIDEVSIGANELKLNLVGNNAPEIDFLMTVQEGRNLFQSKVAVVATDLDTNESFIFVDNLFEVPVGGNLIKINEHFKANRNGYNLTAYAYTSDTFTISDIGEQGIIESNSVILKTFGKGK